MIKPRRKVTDTERMNFIERKKSWTLDAEWDYLGMKKCWSIGEPERMSTWYPNLRQAIDAAIAASAKKGGRKR